MVPLPVTRHKPLRQVDTRLRVLLSINTSWNIVNFRSGLVRALVTHGFEVVAASPVDTHTGRLEKIGCRHVSLAMDSKGTNPLADSALFLRYLRLMQRERPDVYLGWTIKPNIYGSLAARFLGIPVINNVSGLGTAFLRDGWLTQVAKFLYRMALNRSACAFFQNRDDCDLFIRSNLVRPGQAQLLPGSGIDLNRFAPIPQQPRDVGRGPVFILISRLLWDKGVGEYVEAARIVTKQLPQARFRLLGFLEVENHSAVPRHIVDGWVQEGTIEYLGQTDEVRPHIAASDCVVLPSYREGTPRVLLEASAMARPVITTDTPGCRDVVDDGVTGHLCRVRDAHDLAEKMLTFAALSQAARAKIGAAGRAKMEKEYDEEIVIAAYLKAIQQALGRQVEARVLLGEDTSV